jgi:hypothetical protein
MLTTPPASVLWPFVTLPAPSPAAESFPALRVFAVTVVGFAVMPDLTAGFH